MAGTTERPKRKYKKYKRRNRSRLYSVISLVVVCAAIAMAVTIFFKLSVINISGSGRLSAENILEASGIELGDNLFMINKVKARNLILEAYPYISDVRISRHLPDALDITVTDASVAARIRSEGGYMLIDKNARLLESVALTSAPSCPEVKGITPSGSKAGETIDAEESGADVVPQLQELLDALSSSGALPYTQLIDFTKGYDITLGYDGRFEVHLGTPQNFEYKVNYLLQIVSRLSSNDEGIIDIGDDYEAHFIPD